MNTQWLGALRAALGLWLAGLSAAGAQVPQPIPLPPPNTHGGIPFMQAAQNRRTARDFSPKQLTRQTLSDLLWAGFGINRPASAHRTAPSAMNAQEIDIYIALAEGLFLYDAKAQQLRPVHGDDIRPKTGGQPFVKDAPVALVYVADFARMEKAKPEQKDFYSAFDAGCVCQNVYLYCASEGLATVAHDLDRAALAKAMKLRADQKVILAQAVGYPK